MTSLRSYVDSICRPSSASRSVEILAKVLTANDDSGRHGVLIPEMAYSFFPSLQIDEPRRNATVTFELHDVQTREEKTVAWKYYQRYPERRVTRLNGGINTTGPRIVVFVREQSLDGSTRYCFDFAAAAADFQKLVAWCFVPMGVEPKPGAFVRIPIMAEEPSRNPELDALLRQFDSFRKTWLTSGRSGPTGVGYTFETAMGVIENNDKGADFKGIELKAKLKRTKGRSEGKTNLFQETPEWVSPLSMRERIRQLGQLTRHGRWACYSAVTVRENNLGLYLLPRDAEGTVGLRKRTEAIGFWPYATLEKRLNEKHSRAVFVKASSKSTKGVTQYLFDELVYCERPSVENFVSLVKTGDVLFEFTMSEKEGGVIRNHGYPWRLKDQSLLGQLFSYQVMLRD